MTMAQKDFAAQQPRRVWLFDTFEGMPAPTDEDDRWTRSYYKRITNGTAHRAPGGVRDRKGAYTPLDEVRRTMSRTGMPDSTFRFVKGKVEGTLKDPTLALPTEIAVLRLDTDWYTSTQVELDVLWPRLVPGGWLYIDDYSFFGGAHKAVVQWLARSGWHEQARRANAAMRGVGRPRPGCAEDSMHGAFAVWKANASSFSSTHPFEIVPLPAHCALKEGSNRDPKAKKLGAKG